MSIKCVEFDDDARRAVRVVTDPVDLLVYASQNQLDWVEFCGQFRTIKGEVDIIAQTIDGMPIAEIYERNERRLMAA